METIRSTHKMNDSVWPPPPTGGEEERLSRRRSMLANYLSPMLLAQWVAGVQVFAIALQAVTIAHWTAGSADPQSFVNLLSATQLFALLSQAILSLIWTYRLYKNTVLLGISELRYTPASVAVFQIIPFVNFVLPFLALREVWRATASDMEYEASGEDRRLVRVPTLLNVWWCVSVFVSLGSIASGLYAVISAPNKLITVTTAIVSIAARILAINITLQFTRRQEARYAETAASLR